MDVIFIQNLLVIAILISSLLGSLLPIKIFQYLNDRLRQRLLGQDGDGNRISQWISCISCFAGGIFLAVIFLHLLPDAHVSLSSVQAQGVWTIDYPLVEIVSLLGFFLVYMMETLSEMCVTHRIVTHDQSLVTKNPGILVRRTSRDASLDRCEIHESGHNPPVDPHDLHSGNHVAEHERTLMIRTITFIAALIFHSVVEGFAFGVQTNIDTIISLFVGIIVHRTVVAFSVGTRLINCHPNRVTVVICLAVLFAVSSPMFSFVGIVVQNSAIDHLLKEQVTFVLISLSIGTFMYIAFFEMLAPEKSNGNATCAKFFSTLLGFLLIALIMMFVD